MYAPYDILLVVIQMYPESQETRELVVGQKEKGAKRPLAKLVRGIGGEMPPSPTGAERAPDPAQ